jgi:hypothetical protein
VVIIPLEDMLQLVVVIIILLVLITQPLAVEEVILLIIAVRLTQPLEEVTAIQQGEADPPLVVVRAIMHLVIIQR